MDYTVDEALALLRRVSQNAIRHQAAATELAAARDQLILSLFGQEGMNRQALAEASGVSITRISQILRAQRAHDDLDEPVTLPDELRAAVEEALSRFAEPESLDA